MESKKKNYMILYSDNGAPGPENPELQGPLYLDHWGSVESAAKAFRFVEAYEWNADRYTRTAAWLDGEKLMIPSVCRRHADGIASA